MRIYLPIILLFLFSEMIHAQVAESMNYQAVARNSAGVAIANQTINVRLSILRGANTLYSETRQVTTNLLGLFNVVIGSPGATTTTGNFTTINWATNTPEIARLKVELDLTNMNVFTDMGTQPFNTVPYAFTTKDAINAINIGGRYVDPVTVPNPGNRMMWNGSGWTAVKKDSTIYKSSTVASIIAGGVNAPWVFAGQTVNLTVTGTETISATYVSALGHGNGNFIPVATGVCYQETPGGTITNIDPQNREVDFAIPVNVTAPRTLVSAIGSRMLPAGTYNIGFCVKNKSGTGASLNNNGDLTSVIEIKY